MIAFLRLAAVLFALLPGWVGGMAVYSVVNGSPGGEDCLTYSELGDCLSSRPSTGPYVVGGIVICAVAALIWLRWMLHDRL